MKNKTKTKEKKRKRKKRRTIRTIRRIRRAARRSGEEEREESGGRRLAKRKRAGEHSLHPLVLVKWGGGVSERSVREKV